MKLAYATLFLMASFVIAGYFFLHSPHRFESPMIGKPFPDFLLQDTNAEAQNRNKMLHGQECTLVHVFASWCINCKVEWSALSELRQQYPKCEWIAIAYKDDMHTFSSFLHKPHPFSHILWDDQGRLGFALGVVGVPETYILDQNGFIQHKYMGMLNSSVLSQWALS